MKPLVRISFRAPVLMDVWAYKLRLSIHRRGQPWLCLSWANAFPQGGGDLGRRLRRLLATLPPGPVVVIGSDTPGITPADIASAFQALGAADAVVGPALDGGYWLIGLRRTPRRVDPFDGVRWSTAHALADTLANLKGRPVARLRTLEDIDDHQSFKRSQTVAALDPARAARVRD